MAIFTDSATTSSITDINSSSEQSSYIESVIISSKSTLTNVEFEEYTELTTIISITIPDVIVEIPTVIQLYISLSGSAYEGAVLTANITGEATGGTTGGGGGGTIITDPDAPGYTVTYSPSGDWGTDDVDNGLIL